MLRIVPSETSEKDALTLDLDALVREGARRVLLVALRAEVDNTSLNTPMSATRPDVRLWFVTASPSRGK